jgi:DNA-binding transcriptional MerR regulator
MNSSALHIGEVALRAGVSIDTVRYYERRRLLPAAARSEGGFRLFTPDAVERVRFIKQAQELGFSLAEIGLDFFAEWCAPCQRMEKTTFIDERVKALLGRCVFLRIDTDEQPEISRRMNVEGLPDIRFVTPDGKVVKQLRSYQDAESFAEELRRFLQSLAR